MENIDLVDYSRQGEMDEENLFSKSKDATQTIIGCGGIGFWLGIQLAMLGHQNLVLVDGDKVESSNLNRIPVPQTWIGKNKASCLKRIIRYLRPVTAITVVPKHVTPETLRGIIRLSSCVYDCTDNAVIQKEIFTSCAELGVYYRKLGYEGYDVGAYSNYNVWIDSETYRPGYRTSRANAVSSAIIAGLGIVYSNSNINNDFNINLRDLIAGQYKKEE